MSNYIDDVARAIYARTSEGEPSVSDMRLYRIYAVLCLSLGNAVTNEDVHDAWSAWTADERPDHRSLVPFTELSLAVRAMDSEYRDAIKSVAAERRRAGVRP